MFVTKLVFNTSKTLLSSCEKYFERYEAYKRKPVSYFPKLNESSKNFRGEKCTVFILSLKVIRHLMVEYFQ